MPVPAPVYQSSTLTAAELATPASDVISAGSADAPGTGHLAPCLSAPGSEPGTFVCWVLIARRYACVPAGTATAGWPPPPAIAGH